MTKKSILEATAGLLGLTIDFTTENDLLSALGACCDYVLNELSTQYEDLKSTETLSSSDKKLLFSQLGGKVVRVLSVRKNGKNARFTLYPAFIKVREDGDYEVTFTYAVSAPGLTEWLTLPPRFTEETLSLGVAAEYLYRTGYERDAALYSDRYYTALKNLTGCKKNVVLPARRFL
ncbi:MAG: hypothetical protein J5781_02810 [Clostridia bacterium]|nr:hypothetical protein [Clostridia bacterium]